MSNTHNLVKYKNRKIYSKNYKSYITLKDIAGLLRNGNTISVVSKEGGVNTDITSEIKIAAISELLKENPILVDSVVNIFKSHSNSSGATTNVCPVVKS